MFVRRLTFGALLLAAMACAGAPANDPGAAVGTGRNADVITAAELADAAIVSGNAYEAVQRLRPRFLIARGTMSVQNANAGRTQISMDGGALLGVDQLRRLRPDQIAEIRYLNASDATQRFGTAANSGGVILVKSK
jgi:hypothetical protein